MFSLLYRAVITFRCYIEFFGKWIVSQISSDDNVEAIKKRQSLSNNFRELNEEEPIYPWIGAIYDDTQRQKVKRSEREIKDLTCFYNLHNNEKDIFTLVC